LGESIVGERQFIFFDNGSAVNHNQSINPLDENASLVGATEKVYFANSSSVNREEL
jgi:hypothetical protein